MIKINRQEFKKKKLKTAVLFLVFNRPKITKQVFEAIRKAKPPRLYVAADGPRECKLGEVERVEETRAIAMSVDWPCKLRLFFRKRNLGCARAVTEGISWFFKYETQGIIIEDDILPSNAFFYFIEKNLNIYKKKKMYGLSREQIFCSVLKLIQHHAFPCMDRYGVGVPGEIDGKDLIKILILGN